MCPLRSLFVALASALVFALLGTPPVQAEPPIAKRAQVIIDNDFGGDPS